MPNSIDSLFYLCRKERAVRLFGRKQRDIAFGYYFEEESSSSKNKSF